MSTPAIREVTAKVLHGQSLAVLPVLLGGAWLMALAISSPNYAWLGWVTLLPLFHVIRVLSPLRAGAAGALWGGSLFAFALGFSGSTISPTPLAFVLLTAVPGSYAALGAWLTRSVGFSPYLLALGWIGVEFSLGPAGLRLGLLAATQGDGFALRIVGSFAGYVLVAFLVAYFNAALLSALAQVIVAAKPARRTYGGGSLLRKFIAQEAIVELRDLLRQAQPRGPPVPAVVPITRCA
jgi:apolipoprotein N-acyltransferase